MKHKARTIFLVHVQELRVIVIILVILLVFVLPAGPRSEIPRAPSIGVVLVLVAAQHPAHEAIASRWRRSSLGR